MEWVYSAALVSIIAALITADYRYRLAFFAQPLRAIGTVAIAVMILVVWDVVGVQLGIFQSGDSRWTTGWDLSPGIAIEQPLLLFVLSYQALLLWRGFVRREA